MTWPKPKRSPDHEHDNATLREVALIVVVAAAVSLLVWFWAGMP